MVAAYPGPARPRSRSAALSEQDLFIYFLNRANCVEAKRVLKTELSVSWLLVGTV